MKIDSLSGKALVAFALRGIGALAGFAMTIAISRGFGAESAGLLFLALAVVNVIAALSCCGFDTVVMRYTAIFASEQRWADVNGVLWLALRVACAVAVIVSIIVYFAVPFLEAGSIMPPGFGAVLHSIIGVIPAISAITILSQAFLGVGRVPISIFMNLIGIQVCMTIAMFFVPTAALAGYVYLVLGFAMLGVAISWWKKVTPAGKFEAFDKGALYKACFPLWLVMVMASIQQWGGQFVAGSMLNASDVALVATSNRVSFIVSFVLMAINMVIAREFAALYEKGALDELVRVARRSLRLSLMISLPVCGILFVFSSEVMSVFGEEYSMGAPVLSVLLLGQLVNAACGSVGVLLNMSGHERDSRNVALIITPLSLCGMVILTHLFGLIGTATGMALGIALQNIMSTVLVRKRLGFWIFKFW